MNPKRFLPDGLVRNESAARILLAVVAAVLYLASLDLAPHGDAVYYANIIETRRFDQLTLHQGYYLLGAGFTWAGSLVGASALASLAAMNALLGAAMLVVAHALFRHLDLSRGLSWLGVLVLFLCHRVFFNATTVECYALQTLLVWSSILLFLRRRFVLAGVVVALSLWVAPLSAAFALAFPVLAWRRRLGFAPVVRVALTAVVVYAPFLAVFHDELFHGVRGLAAYDAHRAADPGLAAINFVRFQIKHYGLLCLLVVPALLAVRRRPTWAWLTGGLVLPNLYVMTKLVGEDHVFFMPLDLVFAAWIALGAGELARRRLGWVAAVVVVAQIGVFGAVEPTFLRPAHTKVDEQVRAIGDILEAADDPVVIGSWSARMVYVYFNRTEPSYPLEAGPLYEGTTHVGDVDTIEPGRREVYVLDRYRASPHAALVRSEESLAARERALSTRHAVERALDVECSPVIVGPLSLYRCQ